MKSTYKTTISKSLYFSIALAGLAFASSCKKVDVNSDNVGTAKVQLINASTDAGASKLYVDGELRTANSVNYNAGSGYANSYTGLQDVSVQSGSGTTLVTINTQMDAGTYYSYYLAGTSGSYFLIKTQDDVTPATSGKAKVSFVQASTSLTSANLLAGGTSVFSAQAYKSVTAYTEITAGTYVFTVTNGTTSTVLATSASINLVGGKNYTIYTSGLTAVTGTSALAINVVANN